MKLFLVKFVGRKSGAIGIRSNQSMLVENEIFNESQIIEKVYVKHEHCMSMTIIECRYAVLTTDCKFFFPDHESAFSFAENLDSRIKGVYKVINSNTLGPLNIFCSFEDQFKIHHSHGKDFKFKVI